MKNIFFTVLLAFTTVFSTHKTYAQAGNFTFVDVNGNSHDLYAYLSQGKLVFIEAWSTTCGICMYNIQHVEQLYQDYNQNNGDVVVLSLEINAHDDQDIIDVLGGNNSYGNIGNYPGIGGENNTYPPFTGGFSVNYYHSQNLSAHSGGSGLSKTYIIKPGPGNDATQNEVVYGHSGLYSPGNLYTNVKPILDSLINAQGGGGSSNPPADCSTLIVNAGADATITQGQTANLGGSPSASGGYGSYSYAWTPSNSLNAATVSNPIASPSASQCYTLQVTDDSACVQTAQVCITVNPDCSTINADAGANQTIVDGQSTSIGAAPTGSGGQTPYTYNWSNSSSLSSATVANPLASPTSNQCYALTVTDANGCSATDQVCVNVSANCNSLQLDAGTGSTIDEGSSVSLGGSPTAQSGYAPYTFQWTPSSTLNNSSSSNPVATPSSSTCYFVTVTDNQGCSASDSICITVQPNVNCNALTADAGQNTTINQGQSYVIGGVPAVNGGTAPYVYSWSNASSLNASNIANPSATPTTNTCYTLQVTDANNCSATDQVCIDVNVPVDCSTLSANAGNDATITQGNSINLGGVPSASGGLAPYSYLWSPASSITNSASFANPNASPASNTCYTLQVTDANGCQSSDTICITVNAAIDCSSLMVNAGQNTSIDLGDTASLGGNPSASGGYAPYTYSWSGASIASSNSAASVLVNPSSNACYQLNVTDNQGCTGSDSVCVDVQTAAPPSMLTELDGQYCNSTVGANDIIHCVEVSNATAYQWRVTNTSNNQVHEYTRVIPHTGFELGWIQNIQPNFNYNIAVRAEVNGVMGNYGNECAVYLADLSSSTHVSLDQLNTINVYPNPARETLYFDLTNQNMNMPFAVLKNIIGQTVMQQQVNNGINEIQLNQELESGMYVLEIRDQGQVLFSKKVMIQ